MKCTEKEQNTCNVEKMGCDGCYYQELEQNKLCLHCGINKGDYCENCYQELIAENLKLKVELKKYRNAQKEYENHIPKLY